MKNIKDITLSIFAIIGFVAILSSFNNQTHDTVPESHIWELSNTVAGEGGDRTKTYKINKVTGEVFYIVKDKESLVE
jgi:hypothetical protein